MEDLKCPICGEPTRIYMGNARKDRLCGKHADMLKAGTIIKCEECDTFHAASTDCPNCKKQQTNKNTLTFTELPTEGFEKCQCCGKKTTGYAFCRDCFYDYDKDELLSILNKKSTVKTALNNTKISHAEIEKEKNKAIEETDTADEIFVETQKHPFEKGRCITCGYESGENFFCKKCYAKYHKKTLLVKITKCIEVELTDESYESIFKCKDGHMVKSTQELLIDNYLFEHGIRHAYESTLAIDADVKNNLHPDFYLPGFFKDGTDLYIEHWGINEEENPDYKKTKKYKLSKYKDLINTDPTFTLITTTADDIKDLDARLSQKLKYIIPNTIDGKKE